MKVEINKFLPASILDPPLFFSILTTVKKGRIEIKGVSAQ